MSDSIQIEIRRPDRAPVVRDMTPGTYPLGSDEDNRIVLPGEGVTPRHAVLFLRAGDCWVEDLASRTGTFLDDRRIEGRAPVANGQKLRIGQYTICIESGAAERPPQPLAPATKATQESFVSVEPGSDPKRSIKAQIHEELVNRMNLKRLSMTGIGEEDLHRRVLSTLTEIVGEVAARLPPGTGKNALVKEIYDEAVGLGPIEDLLADDEVTEIMVNGPDQVYVEKRGKLIRTDLRFLNDASVSAIIERIVSPLGRRIDESQPYVDARLRDGSRVNAIIHPLSLVGPCLTIRKFSRTPFTDQDLIRFGSIAPLMAEFTRICVRARKNIVISGGTGSGKTTLLNVLSSYLPNDERIVTIEDAAELRLTQAHIVRLEARPPNIENKGAVTIRDLVRNALRMRPDRIVVGECRGGEALDMLQAMNTGHDGSLTTVHANSPRDVISRLETMVLMAGMDLPVRAIREQIASAIDIIVHESRMSDGSRKVINISEVVGLEGDRITMQDIFEFKQTGIASDGKVAGAFRPTGAVPTFAEELEARGIKVDPAMFDPRQWPQQAQ